MRIEDMEFLTRIQKTQKAMQNCGFDLLLAFGNETEPQYVRYFSDYWPSFESAMVLIPAQGNAVLLIGPESGTYAAAWSRIRRIERVMVLRESSEPEYPGEKLNTLANLFQEHLAQDSKRRIGIVGYPLMAAPVYQAIQEAAAAFGCEIRRAEKLVIEQKMIKSPAEIELMKKAAQISEAAIIKGIEEIRVGMTETQVVGLAEAEVRRLGAEGEAYPMWVLSGDHTCHAIGRPDPARVIAAGQLVQLQFGARVGGYASSVGRPVMMGKVPDEVRELVEIGLEAHLRTFEWLQPGIPASEVDKQYRAFLQSKGAQGCNLYGPCHGTGLMEGEHPWIEANSEYILEPGLTYMADTFLHRGQYGLRWEDQLVITASGVERFTHQFLEPIVIER